MAPLRTALLALALTAATLAPVGVAEEVSVPGSNLGGGLPPHIRVLMCTA